MNIIRSILLGIFSFRGIVTIIAMMAVAVVIWFVGPLVNIGGWAPLVSANSRQIAIILFFGALIAYVSIRFLMARYVNARMINSLLKSDSIRLQFDEDKAPRDVDIVNDRYNNTMLLLDKITIEGRKGSDYVNDLPCYLVIGAPGSGKSTLLQNSGLDFPLSDRLEIDSFTNTKGTRNCDWWVSDKAVLIDTAGRYTTQDIQGDPDKNEWISLLELLYKNRQRRPVNGAILTVSLVDILDLPAEEKKKRAEQLRKRIVEMTKVFGMVIPTYVMITKSDIIPGFSEYFDVMSNSDRDQVLGMTFEDDSTNVSSFSDNFNKNFSDIVNRLETRVLDHMHRERNISKRSSIFTFPKEVASSKVAINQFLSEVFRSNRLEGQIKLRGVYFTSGTQDNFSIEKALGPLAKNFGVVLSPKNPQKFIDSKPFFVNRVFSDIVFPEQYLVGTNQKIERGLMRIRAASIAACGIVALGCSLLWIGAYSRSADRIEETMLHAKKVEATIIRTPTNANYEQVLPILNSAKVMQQATGEGSIWAWLDGFGLSATPVLSSLTRSAYDRLVMNYLQPAFVDRVTTRLQASLEAVGADSSATSAFLRGEEEAGSRDLSALRELLRVYLMVGDPNSFDRSVIQNTAINEVNLAYPFDQSGKEAMTIHSNRMVELMPKPLQIDKRLVSNVRARLTRNPRVDQIYARLLRESGSNFRIRPINISLLFNNSSLEVRYDNLQSGKTIIPGIYTREGFYQFLLPRLPIIIKEELGFDWITGEKTEDDLYKKTAEHVVNRYVTDYINSWQQAISSVQAANFSDMRIGSRIVQGLAETNSPLERLLYVIRENTFLLPPGQEMLNNNGAAQGANQVANNQIAQAGLGGVASSVQGGVVNSISNAVSNMAGNAVTATVMVALGDLPWPGTKIMDHFRPIIDLVEPAPGGRNAAMQIRESFGRLYTSISGISGSSDAARGAFQMVSKRIKDQGEDIFSQMNREAVLRPEPVRGIIKQLTQSLWSLTVNLSVQYVNDAWKKDVLPVCDGAISSRYPIYPDSTQDISIRDFSDFFRPGGIMDVFATKYLENLVINKRNGYSAAEIDDVPIPLKQESLAQFGRAKLIQQAFFTDNAANPQNKFSIRPALMDPGILRAVMNIDGKEIIYRHEAQRAYDVEWPTKSDTSSVSIVITPLKGQELRVEHSGPWALFRFVDAWGTKSSGSNETFAFTVGKEKGQRVTYSLRSTSVNNPFNVGALRAFRCPNSL